MKASLSIALILSTALLTACGGSSKSKQSIAEFSLSPYEGRTVSSNSIVGTWVSVSEGEEVHVYDDFTSTYDTAAKEYFVIRDSGFGYVKESCYGWSSTVYQTSGKIEFEGITGTLVDNQLISGARTEEQSYSDGSYSEYTTFEMVKISDSTEEFGEVNITEAGNGTIVDGVNCFQQNSKIESWTISDDTAITEGYLIGLADNGNINFYNWKSDLGDSFTGVHVKNTAFYSDENDTANFRVGSKSDTVYNVSFNGSNEEAAISGTIQTQLPLQ